MKLLKRSRAKKEEEAAAVEHVLAAFNPKPPKELVVEAALTFQGAEVVVRKPARMRQDVQHVWQLSEGLTWGNNISDLRVDGVRYFHNGKLFGEVGFGETVATAGSDLILGRYNDASWK